MKFTHYLGTCILLLLFNSGQQSSAQLDLYPENLNYTTNGNITDIKVWKDKLLIGGDFQEIYRGKDGLVRLNLDESVDFSLPDLQWVSQVISDNNKGLIVNGSKSNSPSSNSFPLLQYDSNGNESRILGNNILYGINRIFASGDTLWIGGSFTKYTQLSGSLTEYNKSNNTFKPILPYINQFILDHTVDDGMGGYFTAGDNYWIPGKHFSRFLHLDANGNPGNKDFAAKGTIRYMDRQDTLLMISGDFRQNGDSSDLVIFNIPSWTRWSLSILTDGTINNTLVADGYLYVGGSFSTINGQARRNLARIHLSTGTIDSWDPNPNKPVNAFELYQNEILIAGEFDTIFGARNRAIIGINQNNVNNISRSIAVSARVNDLLVKGDTLFAGGLFNQITTIFRQRVAAVNLTNNSVLSFIPSLNQEVTRLFIADDKLWVYGNFTNINNGPSTANKMAVYNLSNFSYVSFPDKIGDIRSVIPKANGYVLGGYIVGTPGEPAPYLEAIRISTRERITGIPVPNGPVVDVVVHDGHLMLAGTFTRVNNQLVQGGLAVMDMGNAYQIKSVPAPNSGTVARLFPFGDKLYYTGVFSSVNGLTRPFCAAVLYKQNHLLNWNPLLSNASSVNSIYESGERVYVAGSFIKDVYYNVIATDSLGAIQNWRPNPNGPVNDVYVYNGIVYIFGTFNSMQYAPNQRYVAGISETFGTSTPFRPAFGQYLNHVFFTGKDFILGGNIKTETISQKYFAAFDLKTKTLLNWNPNLNSPVKVIEISGDTMALGGSFTQVTGRSGRSVVLYNLNNHNLLPLDINVSGFVTHVHFTPQEIYVFGGLLRYNGNLISSSSSFLRTNGTLTNWSGGVEGYTLGDLESHQNRIFLTGGFDVIKTLPRRNLVAVEPVSGNVLPWNPSSNGLVKDIVFRDTSIYVCGDFDSVGGYQQQGFAKISWTNGEVLNPAPDMQGLTHSLYSHKNRIYYSTSAKSYNGQATGILGYIDSADNWVPANQFIQGIASHKLGATDQYLFGAGNQFYIDETRFERFFIASMMNPSPTWNGTPQTHICGGDSLRISIISNGTYFSNNQYQVQISNQHGSFEHPLVLGTYSATQDLNVAIPLPKNLVDGANYKVRIKSSSPMSAGKDYINFTYRNPPKGYITVSDSVQCLEGNDFQLQLNTTQSGLTTLWQLDDTSFTGDSFNYQFNQTGNYPIKAQISNGYCSITDSLDIIVNAHPEIHLYTPDTVFCAQQSQIHFLDSGKSTNLHYTFDPGDGSSPGNVFPLTQTYTNPGNYLAELKAMNAEGCTDSTLIAIEIHSLPDVSLTQSADNYCLGSEITWEDSLYSIDNIYAFSSGISGQNPQSLPTQMNLTQHGNFMATVMVTDKNHCVNHDTVLYAVYENPSAFITPLSTLNQCINSNLFELVGNGSWWVNQVSMGIVDTLSLQFSTAGPKEVLLILEDSNACVDTAFLQLLVYDKPSKENIAGPNSAPGDSEQVFHIANAQYPSYQWTHSAGTLLSGQGSDSILLKINPPNQDSIWISSVATNQEGCLGDTMYYSVWTLVTGNSNIVNETIRIYPQPAQSILMVRSDQSHTLKFQQLTDVSGKELSVTSSTQTKGFDLDISLLKPGMYVLRFEAGNQLISKTVIISGR